MNPLYQKINNQPSLMDFKTRLTQIDNNFLNRMQEEARKRGISEKDIQQGVRFIQQLKR